MTESKLWTKDFVNGTLVNSFLSVNYFLLIVVMAAYAMATFGSSPSEAGLATGLFLVGSLVVRPFSGQLIERIGRRRILIAGTTLSLAMTVLYLVVNNIWFLFVIRFIHGLGFSVVSITIFIIVNSIVPKARQGEGISYYMVSATIGSAIGPLLAMYLMQHWGFTVVFVVCVFSSVLSLVGAFSLSVPEIEVTGERLDETKGLKWSNFFESTVIPISIVCALLYFAYSSVLSFLTPYAQEIHLVDAASFFFLIFSVAIFLSRPFTGRWFDSKGENFVMYPAFLTCAIGLILLAQTDHAINILAASVFIGLGFGIIQSCGVAIAVKMTSPQRIGFATSTFFEFADIGVGFGPFVLGLFVPFTGYRGMYLSMAIVSFACIVVYYLLHGRKAIQPQMNVQDIPPDPD